MKIIIMGKGLVGSILEHRLKQDGHAVTTVDAELPNSGVHAAGFLMHHSWFGKRADLIELAVQRYGARKLDGGFAIMPITLFNQPPTIKADAWGMDTSAWDLVVWCLGSWDTVHYQDMKVRAGVSFRWAAPTTQGQQVFHSFWAPFKSNTRAAIAPDTWWAADGAALLPKNLTPERIEQARVRVGAPLHSDVRVGYRPYTATKGLHKIDGRQYAINGAGKIGCLLAIEAAEQLAMELDHV